MRSRVSLGGVAGTGQFSTSYSPTAERPGEGLAMARVGAALTGVAFAARFEEGDLGDAVFFVGDLDLGGIGSLSSLRDSIG